MDYESLIRSIPDWPKAGVVFKDITPVVGNPEALRASVSELADHFKDYGVTKVIGAEARGFIFGAPVACKLKAGFVPSRKPGKLPWKTISVTYDLEYGTDTLQIHQDAVGPDDVVLIVDDLMATGGTAYADALLAKKAGAKIAGFGFLMELDSLHGREKLTEEGLGEYEVFSLVHVTDGGEEG